MKSLVCFFLSLLILSSCSNELTESKALKLLEKDYPKISYYAVYTVDLGHAKKMVELGPVKEGLVRIDSNAGILDQRIFFTDKAKEFILPTPDKEMKRRIQRVKTAEKHLKEITGVRMINENKAVVEFTTSYKNLTPFAALTKVPIKEGNEMHDKAYFSKYTDGWRIEYNDLEFLLK